LGISQMPFTFNQTNIAKTLEETPKHNGITVF